MSVLAASLRRLRRLRHARRLRSGLILSVALAFAGTSAVPVEAAKPLAAEARPATRSAAPAVERPRLAPLQPVAASVADDLERALERAQRRFWLRGLSVAVVADDGRVWAKATGVDESGGELELTDSRPIGSVTKTFTAAMILALVDEGRIELDAPVTDYLPRVALAQGVTVRQLLTHRSGIADLYRPIERWLKDRPDSPMHSNDVLGAVGPRWFRPGAGYAYSNTNYFLLGHIIEAVTHRPVDAELASRFAEPMRMEGTRMLGQGDAEMPAAWSTGFWTSGAMASTPTELARWGQELYAGRVLSEDSTQRMLDFSSGDRYSHGAQLLEIDGRDLPGHTGLLYRSTTLMVHLPDEGATVVLSASTARADLATILAGQFGGDSILELIEEHFAS